jgi:hypothetical protein
MLLPGHVVEVRPAREILSTLDARQALEELPFMPEMLAFCGARFRVAVRAERTCVRARPAGTPPLRRLDDAVVLEGLRCDGAGHGGCQLGCMFYWKERWLRRVDGVDGTARERPSEAPVRLRALRSDDPPVYFCQGTELARATRPAGAKWDPLTYLRMLRVRTVTPRELMETFRGAFQRKLALMRRSAGTKAPVDGVLGLQSGDWVEVRSVQEILDTLDERLRNKGLSFSGDMYAFCGMKLRVGSRIHTILDEGSGRLRTVRDTVALVGADCRKHLGCARQMPLLWRETWLKRAESPPVAEELVTLERRPAATAPAEARAPAASHAPR